MIMYESLSEEIDVLLKRLTEVNEKMGEFPPQNSSFIHTLTRHRDILQDYTQEFRKTQNNLKSRKEREELLQGVKKEIDSSKTALNRRLDLYMKERDHLVSAAFKKIQSRMMDITSRFPTLNNLIHKINMKKRKDSIIIGCVIGICTFLLLYYGFHN
ncbi:Golgi SNAP receptor complex member 1 [Orchesella cincta]|uniref:Golgi SNAP receptor complex member 1 n=1 Tax=Orchesella cincta TaxID=48709 RepID=A0A1D2N934_ORCCI|nr:Golgi SNAP receptor complex member 1 [Orchesella cincta]